MLVTNKCTIHSMCSIMPFVLPTPQNRSVVTSDRWLFVQSMWFNVSKYWYLLCLNLSLTTRFDSFPTKSSFFPKFWGKNLQGFRIPRIFGAGNLLLLGWPSQGARGFSGSSIWEASFGEPGWKSFVKGGVWGGFGEIDSFKVSVLEQTMLMVDLPRCSCQDYSSQRKRSFNSNQTNCFNMFFWNPACLKHTST